MKCDGQYSEAEYQSLERKKLELRAKVVAAQVDMAQRAQEFASLMAQSQRNLEDMQRQIDNLTRGQSEMIVRAAAVMDALDTEEGFKPDKPKPEPLSFNS